MQRRSRLPRWTAAGWVTRFRPRLSRGKHERVYELARRGFDVARIYWDKDGPFVPHEAKWRPRHVSDYRVVEHDLQVNAWVMAYRRLARWIVVDWLGPDQGRIDAPEWYCERRYRPIGLEEANREMPDWEHRSPSLSRATRATSADRVTTPAHHSSSSGSSPHSSRASRCSADA
jgi:hypothetical protein